MFAMFANQGEPTNLHYFGSLHFSVATTKPGVVCSATLCSPFSSSRLFPFNSFDYLLNKLSFHCSIVYICNCMNCLLIRSNSVANCAFSFTHTFARAHGSHTWARWVVRRTYCIAIVVTYTISSFAACVLRSRSMASNDWQCNELIDFSTCELSSLFMCPFTLAVLDLFWMERLWRLVCHSSTCDTFLCVCVWRIGFQIIRRHNFSICSRPSMKLIGLLPVHFSRFSSFCVSFA